MIDQTIPSLFFISSIALLRVLLFFPFQFVFRGLPGSPLFEFLFDYVGQRIAKNFPREKMAAVKPEAGKAAVGEEATVHRIRITLTSRLDCTSMNEIYVDFANCFCLGV